LVVPSGSFSVAVVLDGTDTVTKRIHAGDVMGLEQRTGTALTPTGEDVNTVRIVEDGPVPDRLRCILHSLVAPHHEAGNGGAGAEFDRPAQPADLLLTIHRSWRARRAWAVMEAAASGLASFDYPRAKRSAP
jgi:hypothetical protein